MAATPRVSGTAIAVARCPCGNPGVAPEREPREETEHAQGGQVVKSPRLIILSLAAIALMVGCGKSSTPTSSSPESPLDTSPPAVPEQVALSVDPYSAGGVLTWSPSPSPDVARYEVYEYCPDPTRDNSYCVVFASDGLVTRWVVPPVSTNTVKWYRVRALDEKGNASSLTPIQSFLVMATPRIDPTGPTRVPFDN
jgi:hypothetical protein